MSAVAAVFTRLAGALANDAALLKLVHGIYDRPTPRASLPYVAIGGVSAVDWGTKDRAGSELRIEVRHFASDDNRQAEVAGRIEAIVSQLRGPADGWDIVSARLLRSRSGYDPRGQWSQSFEFRFRCLAKPR